MDTSKAGITVTYTRKFMFSLMLVFLLMGLREKLWSDFDETREEPIKCWVCIVLQGVSNIPKNPYICICKFRLLGTYRFLTQKVPFWSFCVSVSLFSKVRDIFCSLGPFDVISTWGCDQIGVWYNWWSIAALWRLHSYNAGLQTHHISSWLSVVNSNGWGVKLPTRRW